MVTRTYECSVDGTFDLKRPISASIKELCPLCGLPAQQIHTKFPLWGITGSGIPNDSKDSRGYEEWQRSRWSALESECHVDNMGAGDVDATKIVGKRKFGDDK